MNYYTLDDIMELDPCHTRSELEEYMKGRKRVSLSGILSSKASDSSKIWLVTRLLPVDRSAEFAQWCAGSVSHLDNYWTADAQAPYADAVYAAKAAANAQAAYGAYTTTRAARDAAVDAAVWTTRDAARAAARAARAAWSDYDKARRNQVNQLKLIVKENKL